MHRQNNLHKLNKRNEREKKKINENMLKSRLQFAIML